MKRKILVSLLTSIGIVIAGVGVAYAAFTFKANQEGSRQGGSGQAARITMRVEAGMADANSDLVPDDFYNASTSPGGALSFSIQNTSAVPLRVSKIEAATYTCGNNNKQCAVVSANKSGDGTFYANGGDCNQWVIFAAPTSFDNWPTIGPRSTLQVNGTDNSRLGAGMIHLSNSTPQGCQGATFAVTLNVTADEVTRPAGNPVQP